MTRAPTSLQPIGLALWGPIAAVMSLDHALWLAFALQLIAALVLLALRDVRQLPAHPRQAL